LLYDSKEYVVVGNLRRHIYLMGSKWLPFTVWYGVVENFPNPCNSRGITPPSDVKN
jgi:hypothetical protein